MPLATDLIANTVESEGDIAEWPEHHGTCAQPFVVIDEEGTIAAWNIPGAISPRLQLLAETAVTSLLAEVPDAMLPPSHKYGEVQNTGDLKFGTGIRTFSPCHATTSTDVCHLTFFDICTNRHSRHRLRQPSAPNTPPPLKPSSIP